MQNGNFLSRLWMQHRSILPRLRRVALISAIAPVILLDAYTYFTLKSDRNLSILGETSQILAFLPYVFIKDRRVGIGTFSTVLLVTFSIPGSHIVWAWILVYAMAVDLLADRKSKLALIQLSIFTLAQLISGIPFLPAVFWTFLWGIFCASFGVLIRNTKDRLEEMRQEAERSKEIAALQEIVDSSVSTLAQREIVLDADLDGIERIPALHRSELGRLLVAFIRENTLNALKYNFPRDLVSLFVEQEQDTLFISFSSPWHDQKVPEEMHGGYGLWALQDRFENAGGSLSSNRIGASWTVLASLPWNEIATPTTNAISLMSPPDGAAYA